MSAGMPELGSKISLISKADIRYEGRLFTVDPQECTIALSNVRSFGTEDRDASFPVAPQNQVYDYILFRGSDIKDIRVVHNVNPIPNDPAIVTLSVPPPIASSGFQQQQQQAGFSQPGMLGAMGTGAFGSQYSGLGGLPSGLAPGMGIPSRLTQESRNLSSELADGLQAQPPLETPPGSQEQDLISGRSSTGTPARSSPTIDQGTQVGAARVVGSSRQQQSQGQNQGQNQNQNQGQQRQQYRDQRGGDRDQHRDNRDQNRGDYRGDQHRDYRDNRNRAPVHQQQNKQGWNNEGPWRQQQQQQHDGWGPQNNRSGWRGGPRRGRGRGGNFQQRMPGPPGQPGQMQQPLQQQGGPNQAGNAAPGQKKNVLKFEGDYDFEQANTEFENLRSQLANIKLTATAAGQLPSSAGEVVPPPVPVVVNPKENGEEKKELVDSGNETGAGEGETEEESESFYDKAKSFFDNISCEAIERSKGCSQRTDWRQERKLNSETFGVASARRGYRGRGGYYRGGNMYRGGNYRGGYRGRGMFNRNNNNPGQQQQQQQQQQQGGGQRAAAAAGGK